MHKYEEELIEGYKLHEYQIECLKKIDEVFKKQDKQLIQLPTGSGKTFIFLNYLKRNCNTGLIIVPNIELQDQVYFWGRKFGLDIYMKNSDKPWKPHNFYVVTAASLNYEATKFYLSQKKFDIVVIDEAHRAQCDTYLNFLKFMKGKFKKLIGFTATPERMDKKPLLEIFETLSFDMNIVDLVEKDFLCNIEAYRLKTGIKIDTHNCSSKDILPVELKKLDIDQRNSIIIDSIKENCRGRKTLVFCLDITHAEKISYFLKKERFKCASIHGKLHKRERRQILKDFKDGELELLTNCQLLTEGFDEPSIDCLFLARPTKSKSLYCQMIGRGVRKYPGKKICKLYEIGDNGHNICSFNVAAGKEPEFDYDYKPGTTLLDLEKHIRNMKVEDLIVQTDKFDLFAKSNSAVGNSVNIFKTSFYEECILKSQEFALKDIIKQYPFKLNFLEASFLIFKEKIKGIYG